MIDKIFIYFDSMSDFIENQSLISNKSIVFIGDTKQIYTHGDFYSIYSAATTSNAGLMSATDKTKLDELSSETNGAFLGTPDGSAFLAGFDALNDTVWNKELILTSALKALVKANLDIQNIVFNTEYDATNNKAATMSDIPSSLPANGGNASTVNNHTVLTDVPANAVFTDTTYVFNTAYDAVNNKVATVADIPVAATLSTAGLMSAADKIKLDNTKNITVSSSEPTSNDGLNGDIWFVYDAS